MTTSSNTSWELTKEEIIKSALRKCGVLAKGQTPSAEDYTDCGMALNALLQSLATKGMPLWKRLTYFTSLIAGTQTYTVSNVWKIAQIVVTDLAGGTQIEVVQKSLYDFNRLPRNTTGQPVHYTYAPGLESGVLSLWPIPDSGTALAKQLQIVYQKEFDGFINLTDTPDFPAYWSEAIIYGLAQRIAPEYGVPITDRDKITADYNRALNDAEGYGDEDGSLFLSPDRRR